ncbi:hypothetical protein [Nocardiopsis sp. MG754419]|uniref:hypothetical protein n=1 Tax=Nocardiopsis sp. MG754419 TaxID=2259865 RepID=UPI001BAA0E2F|nr:hypothetical protein [Nocardiopsis sp. MG754419]MBR8744527.1 hypothetical protein [Nocardiopsis sp. MG754419]
MTDWTFFAWAVGLGFLVAAAITCVVRSRRWRRRHGVPENPRQDAPGREERRRVRPYLRTGRVASDADLARVTVAAAHEDLRLWEDPWSTAAQFLIGTMLTLNFLRMSLVGDHASPGLLVFQPFLLGVLVYLPLRRRQILRRARRAIAANEERAAHAAHAHRENRPSPTWTGPLY